MVGHENHGGVRAGFIEQRAEHLIVQQVGLIYDVAVELEIALGDPSLARRMILHKAVGEMVDGVVVDGKEIPRLVFDQPSGGRMNGNAFAQDLHQRSEAFIFVLIDLGGLGDKRLDHGGQQLVGMKAQVSQRFGELGRMHAAGQQRPDFVKRAGFIANGAARAVEVVGYRGAPQRLGGMAGPPADDDAPQAVLIQDVPYGLALARQVGDGANAQAVGERSVKP